MARVFCGAGGNRTLVQTRYKYAFYMLILLLFVGFRPVTDNLTEPYSLFSRPQSGKNSGPALTFRCLLIKNRQAGSLRDSLSAILDRRLCISLLKTYAASA
jgi:hypothetical protein